MRKYFLLMAAIVQVGFMYAQKLTPEQYIDSHKELAIREMKRMGVPAAIKLAQGLLETESGNSALLKKSNNHFGIKCKSNWSGRGVSHDDDALGECFRTYNSAEESYRDHSNFLRGSERYAFLFNLDPADYKGWAYGLKKAGYATNPRYPEQLINSIEKYNLQQYSLTAAGDVPNFDKSQFKDDPEVPFIYAEDTVKTLPKASGSHSGRESVLKNNHTRCIQAMRGTSLLAIATRFDIPLVKLLEYNDLTRDGLLEKDQLIYLDKKPLQGSVAEHITLEGESLYDVAQQQGVQLESLAAYNQLGMHTSIAAGTRLLLRPSSIKAGADVTLSVEKNRQGALHTVQPKEGLLAIARKYGVSVAQLRTWNKLENDQLSIGQQLVVSP